MPSRNMPVSDLSQPWPWHGCDLPLLTLALGAGAGQWCFQRVGESRRALVWIRRCTWASSIIIDRQADLRGIARIVDVADPDGIGQL